MELNHLKYFYYVIKNDGFTKAAEELRIQQPVVSRAIKVLEDSINEKLIERSHKKIILTPTGKMIYESCLKIFGEFEDLKKNISNEQMSGPLNFGASDPISSFLLPDAIDALLQGNPLIRPSFISAPARGLLDLVQSGQIEFAFFFYVPESDHEVDVEKLQEIEFHYVIGKSAFSDNSKKKKFIGSREIDNHLIKKIPKIDQLVKNFGNVSRVISTNNFIAQKKLAEKGFGVALLPDFMVKAELNRGSLVSLFSKETFKFNIKLVKRRGMTVSKAGQQLIEIVRSL